MRTEFAKLMKRVKKGHPDADVSMLRKAYSFADEAHRGQVRLSGDPFITHTLAVADVLAIAELDVVTVSAGLLHDVLEDTKVTYEQLLETFGENVAQLVDGVTKIGSMNKAAPTESREEKQAANLRKMLVATVKDVRVILIKLADRLHNLRTIEYHPQDKIEQICQETLDIYAPLANRLGLSSWKWELEDHAFHYLHPKDYSEMARQVAMKRTAREKFLKHTVSFLEERLTEAEVNARVIGRPKHLYSIYQKMRRRGKTFDNILDVLAIRIITHTVSDCYNAVGIVHHVWPPVPGRFKDYIAMPKLNMYQSIHTTVMLEEGRPLEIQIRTDEMDRTSREGIAAHWNYKDAPGSTDENADIQLKWLRQMHEWLQDAHAPDELFDTLRREISGISGVYVFTPTGEVRELPKGATPIDFAYMIHTDIGDHCIGAKANDAIVPLRYHLQTGDVVEILTSKNQRPNVDWLDFVATGRARTRIRSTLRELGLLAPVAEAAPKADLPAKVVRLKPKSDVRHVDDKTRDSLIRVEGSKGTAVQFAKCCDPMPGLPVIGYITKRQGITIHRTDCKLLGKSNKDAQRMVEASWEGDEVLEVSMWVTMGSRPNVLADITNAMRPMNIDITHAEYRPGDLGDSVFVFAFEAADQAGVERVRSTLLTVSGVIDVATLPGHQKARAQ